MWFLGLFVAVFFIGMITYLLGSIILRAIYWSNSPKTTELQLCSFFVGTGALGLIFGWTSYLGIAGKYAGPLILVVLLLVVIYCLMKGKLHFSKLNREYLKLLVIALIGIILGLKSILLFHAYNPFNDTFTYLSISDYLQNFPFSKQAEPGNTYPILAQVLGDQVNHLRMGANFFLAFIQSILPVERSYQIYPAVLTWGLLLNVLGIYLAARWLMLLPKLFAFCAALIAVFSINSLYYSISNGFLPQLYGMAFFTYVLSILS